jgi:hypothetical protein
MIITADDLLVSVKRGGSVPTSQGRFSSEDILALADEETASRIVPLIKSLKQDYFLYTSRVSTVASQNAYQIPYRAVGGAILDLKYSNNTSGSNPQSLALISSSEVQDYVGSETDSGDPVAFYFKADKVVLVPTPATSGYVLEFTYESMPNDLVLLEKGLLASAVSSTTVTTTTMPTAFTTGVYLDFIAARGQSQVLAFEGLTTNISSTVCTFNSSVVPSDFAIGDYLCIAGQSCVLQIPREARPLLALCVQSRIMEAIGDFDAFQALESKIIKKMDALKGLLAPRVTKEPAVILGKLRPGMLNGRSLWRYRP